jgi:hypothetical protein
MRPKFSAHLYPVASHYRLSFSYALSAAVTASETAFMVHPKKEGRPEFGPPRPSEGLADGEMIVMQQLSDLT